MIASVADAAWSIASSAPWSFLIGALVGFLLSNRWQLVRRNGKEAGPDDGMAERAP